MRMDTTASPRRQDAAARAERAAELRVGGATWASIAELTGYSAPTHAARAVREYFGEVPSPDREASRALWRERVELLWTEAYADVLARRPGAVRAATAVAQRAAAMDGLDAPSAVALYSPDAGEYSAVLVRMLELDRQSRGAEQAGQEADIFGEYLQAEVIGE